MSKELDFEPLKMLGKKGHLGNASGYLRYVIAFHLKHYHSCDLGDRKNNDDKEIQTAAGCTSTYKHLKK